MKKERFRLMSLKRSWGCNMKFKVEYSQIVRRKMKALKKYLTEHFDPDTAVRGLEQITAAVRRLEDYPEEGTALSDMFGIDTDFRCLYVNHNYMFYYIQDNKVIVAEMFDEREDFMYKLFGISSESEESKKYWNE